MCADYTGSRFKPQRLEDYKNSAGVAGCEGEGRWLPNPVQPARRGLQLLRRHHNSKYQSGLSCGFEKHHWVQRIHPEALPAGKYRTRSSGGLVGLKTFLYSGQRVRWQARSKRLLDWWWPEVWGKFENYPAAITSEYAVKVCGQGHVVAYTYAAGWHDGITVATYGNPDGTAPDGSPNEIADRMPVSIDIHNQKKECHTKPPISNLKSRISNQRRFE
jgi:hypothetical protein